MGGLTDGHCEAAACWGRGVYLFFLLVLSPHHRYRMVFVLMLDEIQHAVCLLQMMSVLVAGQHHNKWLIPCWLLFTMEGGRVQLNFNGINQLQRALPTNNKGPPQMIVGCPGLPVRVLSQGWSPNSARLE